MNCNALQKSSRSQVKVFPLPFHHCGDVPLTSLSLNPFRCNVCPANKQQSEKANKMLTGIGCYLYTLSAFDIFKKNENKNITQNPSSHPRRQQSPGKSAGPRPCWVKLVQCLSFGATVGGDMMPSPWETSPREAPPRKLRWNLKIPPKGKGKTSTIYKQTTHFWGFFE